MTHASISSSQASAAVLQHPAAPPQDAARHFAGKLAFETDPADVHAEKERP